MKPSILMELAGELQRVEHEKEAYPNTLAVIEMSHHILRERFRMTPMEIKEKLQRTHPQAAYFVGDGSIYWTATSRAREEDLPKYLEAQVEHYHRLCERNKKLLSQLLTDEHPNHAAGGRRETYGPRLTVDGPPVEGTMSILTLEGKPLGVGNDVISLNVNPDIYALVNVQMAIVPLPTYGRSYIPGDVLYIKSWNAQRNEPTSGQGKPLTRRIVEILSDEWMLEKGFVIVALEHWSPQRPHTYITYERHTSMKERIENGTVGRERIGKLTE